MLRRFLIVCGWLVLTGGAGAQVWTELGDAPSFPDSHAQVTRGEGILDTIVGATDGSDLRDAYCIKIVDPGSFLATTDPDTDAGASGNFDTRLFLFGPHGAPILANDDTPPSASPFLSTLTGVATDGSGFVLSQPGEYVLIVAGFSDDPQDAADVDLFNLGPNFDFVHAPNPAAASFDHWEGGAPARGDYTVKLAGVDPCQNKLDAVFGNTSDSKGAEVENQICLGDGSGGFSTCYDASGDAEATLNVGLGFVDGDSHLDAVFGNLGNAGFLNRVCLGDGNGRFSSCSDVSEDLDDTHAVALGHLNSDDNLDAVFGNTGSSVVCLGDGSGGFACSDISGGSGSMSGVGLGFVDGDVNLDVVFADELGGNENLVCLGDGSGGFTCSDITGESYISNDVALGHLDADGDLDAYFANTNGVDRVCLGDGSGGFACSDVSGTGGSGRGVALGLMNGDGNLDAVIANRASDDNVICLGDGSGGFSSCTNVGFASDDTFDVALGHVNEDGNLDAVFGSLNSSNRVCLGDGNGGFSSCSDASGESNPTFGLALGELGAGQIFADGFESGDTSAWSSTVGANEDVGIFVSSTAFFGDFGGLAFADATCQSLGTAAIPGSGQWVAWLSDSGTDARDRIPQPGPGNAYVRASQPATVIANDMADLTDGTLDVEVGNFDENGNPLTGTGTPWTGTNADGTEAATTCTDWGSTAAGGVTGSRFSSDSNWTNDQNSSCNQELHFYCFGPLP